MADQNYNLENAPSLDEIVFEGRNKAYGAYDLRRHAKSNLLKAFLIGTGLFLLALITPLIILKIKQGQAKDEIASEINLKEIVENQPIIEEPKEKEPEPEPEKPKEEEKVEIIQNVVPEPKRVVVKEVPPPPQSIAKETTSGTVPQVGVKKPDYRPEPPKPKVEGNATATVEVKPKANPDEIYTSVDQVADFPGGEDGFREKISSTFDPSVIEGQDGVIVGNISFVVNLDGSITDIKVEGKNSDFNREAERSIRSIRTKWKPAKKNGQAVRSRFRLPLKMLPPD